MGSKIIRGIDFGILDKLSEYIVVVDSTSHKIVFANKSFKKVFSNEKEIIGENYWEFYGAKSHHSCNINKPDNKKQTIEIKTNKGIKYYSVSISQIKDDKGRNYYLHSSRDITKEKEKEVTLKRSKERYKVIFENIYNVFFEVDLSGEILNIAPSIERISKYSRNYLIGKNVMDFYKDSKARKDYLDNLLNYGSVEDYTIEFKDKDGGIILCAISSRIIIDENDEKKIVGVLRDIREEIKIKENLNKMNSILLTLFDTSTSLQDATEISQIGEIAIDTFFRVGYDRVRIYTKKNGEFCGIKSNHIVDDDFFKISFKAKDKYSKAYKAIRSKRPVIFKEKITKLSKILDKDGLRESATLPLLSKNDVIGLISIDNKFSKNKIKEEELEILMTFANQIAVAIDNSVLYQENKNQLKVWSSLYDISSEISKTLDLEKILNLMVIKIIKLLKADLCKLMLLDESRENLIPYAVCDLYNNKSNSQEQIKVKDSISGNTISKNKVIYISDISSNKLNKKTKKNLIKKNLKTLLSVPLQIDNVPIGVINLYNKKDRVYVDDEIELLLTIANQAAVVIENSRLYERVRNDKNKLSAMLEMSKVINSKLEVGSLLEELLNMTMKFTNSDYSFITVLEKGNIVVRYSKGYLQTRVGERTKDNCVCSRVFKDGKVKVVDNTKLDHKKYIGINKLTRSFITVPLMRQKKVFAVMVLESKNRDNYKWYDKSLKILINHISVAIDNSFNYDRIKSFNDELKNEIEKATSELRQKNEELEKIDKMKDEFVSNVSHELRTPLTSIMGYTKLLRAKRLGNLNDQQLNSIRIVEEESDRLARLINNVLDISRLESGKVVPTMESIDIKKVISSSVNTVQGYAEENKIKIHVNYKLLSTKVTASSDMLKQVMLNLLNNAIKFTSKGGKITVNLKSKKKDYIKVEVIDTGVGIPKEDLKRLFNKFFQVDSSLTRYHGGTGLGLVIVKHIIDLHKGEINVSSKEGVGSNFSFIIPIKQKQ